MADKLLRSIKFPTLPDRYVIGDSTLTEEGAAAEAKAVGEALATKADTKGRYEDLIVGGAEQLMADEYETDKEPYLFRPTGGSADVGNREYLDKIVGGTVGWNQLVQNGNFENSDTWATYSSTLSVSDNVANITATNSANPNINTRVNILSGHKYLLTYNAHSSENGTISYYLNDGGLRVNVPIVANTWTPVSAIRNATSNVTTLYLYSAEAEGYTVSIKNVNIYDLTAMFNPTIADYIYSLEQSQAGAGVAWFRNYFSKDYYAYNAGTLRSVEGVNAHETVGFNQWDEEWVYRGGAVMSANRIPLQPNTTYFFVAPTGSEWANVYCKDENGNTTVLGNPGYTFTTTSDTVYGLISTGGAYGTTYKNDICINLSDPTRNGEYEPYTKHTYPLDSSLTLRGIPKLVDGKLAFDGDVYLPSGEVQRRYGLVDLGTLNYTKTQSGLFGTTVNGAKGAWSNQIVKAISIYAPITSDEITGPNGSNPSPDMTMAMNENGTLYINNLSYTDVASFKAAMSGVYLVYELATPTTETADGYEQYQICDPSGTEEFVTDSIVPVGHETRYPHDLKKKIETAPDSPSTDGTYLMKRSGGKNTYMALPSTPSANGAYVLTVTVSGGTASYSWTSKE